MGAVAMDIDALHGLGIDIARNVTALFHNQHALSALLGLPGKHRTE